MQDVSPSSITHRDQKEREKNNLSEEKQRPEEAETGNNVEKVKGKKNDWPAFSRFQLPT